MADPRRVPTAARCGRPSRAEPARSRRARPARACSLSSRPDSVAPSSAHSSGAISSSTVASGRCSSAAARAASRGASRCRPASHVSSSSSAKHGSPSPTDPVFCGLAGGRLQETILADIIRRAASTRRDREARHRPHAAPHRRDLASSGGRGHPPRRRVPRPRRSVDGLRATPTSSARSSSMQPAGSSNSQFHQPSRRRPRQRKAPL